MKTTQQIGPSSSWKNTSGAGRWLRRLGWLSSTHTRQPVMRFTGSLQKGQAGHVVKGHLDRTSLNGLDSSLAGAGLKFIKQLRQSVINSYRTIPIASRPYVHSISWTVEITWGNGISRNTQKASSGSQESTS